MHPAVRVEDLGKCYQIDETQPRGGYHSLREDLMNLVKAPLRRFRKGSKSRRGDFWALKGVGFELKPGEVLGVVGRNGAGKSTLLKLLARVTKPTTGRVELRGRIGSLLEVGTGFHPELTGRENIHLNGTILGMKRSEIARNFDAIVAFAEVERFLDTPVKRYSSGMYTRLAFAVAAHLEPEILVVDEVLAVGDAEFQKKCMKKMGDVAGEGRTILFVSHNMGAVQTVCRRALLLARGEVKLMGTVPEVVAEYLKVSDAPDGVPLADRRDRTGDGRFRFEEFRLLDAHGRPAAGMVTGEDCYLCLRLSTPPAAAGMTSPLDVAVSVRDFQGRKLTEVATHFTNSSPKTVAEAREVCCLVPRVPLLAGQYRIDLWCGTMGETQDWILDAAMLRVEEGNYFRNYEDARLPTAERQGDIMIPQVWNTAPPKDAPSIGEGA
jgi:lipopolysaccharide transport system ATP-binding protein